ncbi:MAG: DEAD/DEAH box helicase family protein [Deltaproteobacteria bacterium]|nr:DEAD/DEAH box helicase family protein [Deltaproteobacteria bacterium]
MTSQVLNELKAEKSALLVDLENLKRSRASKTKIRKLAEAVASYEAQIAHLLLSDGKKEQAIINLISQASCLVDAQRKVESRRVYERVIQLADRIQTSNWVNNELARIGASNIDLNLFMKAKVNILDNDSLRLPQKGAYEAALKYFEGGKRRALIQLPVGCGKTGAMSVIPFGVSRGRVLVVAPNLEIRRNLVKNLDFTNPENFWKKTGVFTNGTYPKTAELDSNANVDDCDHANILVTNIQQFTSKRQSWLEKFFPDYFDLILLDEGHHAEANTWQTILSQFSEARVASFTATPLRSDGKKVEGDRIYRYPVARAITDGFIKNIASRRLEPAALYFTYRGQQQQHSIEEVIKLREETWYSKGVALSRECNEHIVDASIESMLELREGGEAKHQIIAAACSIDHANQIRSLYEERGRSAAVLHSDMTNEDQEDVRFQLEAGRIDAVVQVAMLGEGADYPNLSVAAIFRPFRHVVPYVQFIGRVMRVIKQDSPNNPDNRAYIVSHVGLNVDRWWDELKQLDEDDQAIYQEIANGTREFDGTAEGGETKRRRFRPSMEVVKETISRVTQKSYLTLEDREAQVDEVMTALELRGVDPDAPGLRDMIKKELNSPLPQYETVKPFVPQPIHHQKERQQAKRRLNERVRSAAKEVLTELGLSPVGVELPRRFPRIRAKNNLGSAIILLNLEVNSRLHIDPKDRNSLSIDELKKAHDEIDEAVDAAVVQLQTETNKES